MTKTNLEVIQELKKQLNEVDVLRIKLIGALEVLEAMEKEKEIVESELEVKPTPVEN